MAINTLPDLFVKEVQDLYSAEEQIIEALPERLIMQMRNN
jgi:ferritin-like metal-binding protein YciE